ncbi:MAG: hypothetical protein AAB522_01865 [Patescibacteria group bacterium]
MVKNFWGGITTVVCCALAILWLGNLTESGTGASLTQLIVFGIVLGIIIVGMWSFNLLSYRGGASIALKKLVMYGSFLTAAMIMGVIFFGETFTAAKAVGILLYVVAFIFMDPKTWKFVKSQFTQPSSFASTEL